MGQRTSVYLDDDLHAAAKATGVPLAELVRRGLAAGTEPTAKIPAEILISPGSGSALALAPGEPCHGVACSAPGCWNRDTARYGLHRLPLYTACAAALKGEAYERELPPGTERVIRRGAA